RRIEVPDRAAEDGDQQRRFGRKRLEPAGEVAGDRLDRQCRVVAGDRPRALAQNLLADVDRGEALERAELRQRVEQEPRPPRVARAELDQRPGPWPARDLAGART